MTEATKEKTSAGNYFISNYPPYSFWKSEYSAEAVAALDRPPAPDTKLGIYLHIPFCRKRCHFCYFRVYTDKNAEDIQKYLDAAERELALYTKRPIIGGRLPQFVYFGGGTPSYLSVRQLTSLTDAMKRLLPWDNAEEVTFECEPGTLTETKVKYLKEMGVTRLSLGVEHFDADILELNGRAHREVEIDRAYGWIQETGFPQPYLAPLAALLFASKGDLVDRIIFGIVAFVLITIIGAFIRYWFFRYRIEDDSILIREGVLKKTQLDIKFDRIQAINTQQNIIYRQFDLVTVQIDTAGSAKQEGHLPAIKSSLADSLKTRIRSGVIIPYKHHEVWQRLGCFICMDRCRYQGNEHNEEYR